MNAIRRGGDVKLVTCSRCGGMKIQFEESLIARDFDSIARLVNRCAQRCACRKDKPSTPIIEEVRAKIFRRVDRQVPRVHLPLPGVLLSYFVGVSSIVDCLYSNASLTVCMPF